MPLSATINLLARLRRERARRRRLAGHRRLQLTLVGRRRPGGDHWRRRLGESESLRSANGLPVGVQRLNLPLVLASPGQRFGILVAQGIRRNEDHYFPTRGEDFQAIGAGPRLLVPQEADQPHAGQLAAVFRKDQLEAWLRADRGCQCIRRGEAGQIGWDYRAGWRSGNGRFEQSGG